MEHATLSEAYVQGLRDLLVRGHSVPTVSESTSPASGFGQEDLPSLELLGYSFTVLDPGRSLLISPAWQPRLDYAFALLVWSLSGADDVSTLSYYHPAATRFSDDGSHLSGAFGHRMVHATAGDQVARAARRLRQDPATRRAIMMILSPHDAFSNTREFPCAACFQLFRRGGQLHAVTTMRAQQALFVLPYDAFLFIGFQRSVAAELGLSVGTYTHFAGTYHVYERDLELVQAVLGAGVASAGVGDVVGVERTRLAEVTECEQELRRAATLCDSGAVRAAISRFVPALPTTLEARAATVFGLKAARKCRLDEEAERLIALLPQDLRGAAAAVR